MQIQTNNIKEAITMKLSVYMSLILGTGAIVSEASAQSSLTISGTVDLALRYVKADAQSNRVTLASDGLNSSELVIRGTEDLGDGLKAGFNLGSQLMPDTGMSNATKFWNRRSYLTISNRLGEIRLGRDYTPTFWTQAIFDPFGFVGLGASIGPRQLYAGTRLDNSLQYLTPANLSGFSVQAMISASEGGTTLDRPVRYVGARAAYATGPLNVAVAVAEQRFAVAFPTGTNGVTTAVTTAPGDTMKMYNIGASWDFRVVKLTGFYDHVTLNAYRESMALIGAILPFGASAVQMSYSRSSMKNSAITASNSINHLSLGYVYNLSKRTAMYATVSRLDNKDATRLTIAGAAGPTTAGGKSRGAEFGVRHFF